MWIKERERLVAVADEIAADLLMHTSATSADPWLIARRAAVVFERHAWSPTEAELGRVLKLVGKSIARIEQRVTRGE